MYGDYDIIGGMKNGISKMVLQKYTIVQIIAPREKAISLAFGIMDEQILNTYGCLNRSLA